MSSPAATQAANPASNRRLLITHLELENFKSYYGRRTIGPFHKRFSSIIGPNGSGKSNVIDALLFVFGKNAKKIRLKKVSELVHKSSDHQDCTQARVTVHFQVIIDQVDSDDDYTVVEGSEFSITRAATVKNKSQYFINRNRAQLQDVKRKLETFDIDLKNNRFLILQGEVESISLMKPKGANENEEGLLEYLEDIIGSNEYVERIEKAAEQEELLAAEVQERLNRVKVVERDRDKLDGAKTEAEEFLRMELEMFSLEGVQRQYEIFNGERRMSEETERKSALETQLEEEKSRSVGVRQELKEMEADYQELVTQRDSIVEELESLNKEFQSQEQEDVTLKERSAYLKKEIKKVKTNKTKAETIIEKSQNTIARNDAQIPELQEANVSLSRRLEQSQAEEEKLMDAVQSRVAPFREQMEAKQKELMPLKDLENQAQQRLDVVVDQINSYEKSRETGAQRYNEVQDRMRKIESDIQTKLEHSNRINDELQTLGGRQAEARQAIGGFEGEEKGLEVEVGRARQKCSFARHAMESQGARHYIAAQLMEAQAKGRLSGIIGRLGDLGRIDDEYDIAVSTAGAGGLNCIVVEQTHHAQQAVKHLKKNKLGRATFIILDKQQQSFSRRIGPIETPRGALRLFDLITPHEERYAVAFYYALRDTLVATNLEEGNQLAFGGSRRWRVATKAGQLIETSGTMSGGGGKPKSGLMSSAPQGEEVTQEQVSRMESEFRSLEERLRNVRDQRRSCVKECEQLDRDLKARQTAFRKLNLQIDGDRQRLSDLESQLPELEASSRLTDADRATIDELSVDQQRLEREKVNATRNCASLNDVIEDLQQQILEAGGAELREKRKEVENLQNQLNENETTVTRFGVEIETSRKKMTANTKKVATLEKELTQMTAEREETKAKKEKCLQRAMELMEIVEAKKGEETQLTRKWKEMEEIVKGKEKIVAEAAKLEMELDEKIGECKSAIRGMEKFIRTKRKNLSDLVRKIKKNRKDLGGGVVNPMDVDEDDNEDDGKEKENNDGDDEAKADDPNQPSPMDVDDDEEKERDDEKASEEENTNDSTPDPNTTATESHPEPMDVDDDDEPEMPMVVRKYLESDGSFRVMGESELKRIDSEELKEKIESLKEELKKLKPNMGAIEAYRRKDDEYVSRLEDLTKVKKAREENRHLFDSLRNERLTSFMDGFNIITTKLKEMYRMLTQGGDAELELVDSIDPFSEGVQFSVRPPKKSWKNISNLSGGEKTLSSMALVFALHHYRPTPLYVMDEIDAALDFKNVSIVANYIKARTKNAQFIIISLRNNMFELANRLVGIYKTHNASKSITINPSLFVVKPTDRAMRAQQGQTQRVTGRGHGQSVRATEEDEMPLQDVVLSPNVRDVIGNGNVKGSRESDDESSEISMAAYVAKKSTPRSDKSTAENRERVPFEYPADLDDDDEDADDSMTE